MTIYVHHAIACTPRSYAVETAVRQQLSRRYDLCDDTWVHTTTLLTATDRADDVRRT